MKAIAELKDFLETPKEVMITMHHKPDADALGSALALKLFLEKYGHKVYVISPSEYPAFLEWMTGNDDVIIYTKGNDAEVKKIIMEVDLICCLDFSALHRIFKMGAYVSESPAKKFLVDHHRDPEHFADYELWDETACATAELIYDLIEMFGGQDKLDIPIAECIYAGIMTDTGSFRFPSTSAKVHRIIAHLIEIGVSNSKVHRLIYDTSTESRLRLLGFILTRKLFVLPDLSTAYILLTKRELYKFNAQTGDTEGVVNYALAIKGIKFATLMKESEGIIKLSFRSVGDFDVSGFANEHFEGGGHKNAAGGRSTLSLDETEKKFLKLLDEYRDKLVD